LELCCLERAQLPEKLGGGDRVKPEICPKRGWRLGGVGTFGVVAYVQEVTVSPGELLADADLIHYTMGASEKDGIWSERRFQSA
jgi:hypothetical protein